MTRTRTPLIVHHAPCLDGFTAAWIAWKHFEGFCELRGAAYTDALPPDDVVVDRDVFVLDFSYSKDVLLRWVDIAKSVTVLDHHATAKDELAPMVRTFEQVPHCLHVEFDMERSGARMAWDHWHPGETPPKLVQYVEDRDLWRWALPRTKEVSAFVGTFPMVLSEWGSLAYLLEEQFNHCADQGAAVLRARDLQVARALESKHGLNIGGFEVPAVNSCLLQSEIGHELVGEWPFAAVYYRADNGTWRFSLRSTNEREDVSRIAKLYGGGGHRNAAGFSVRSLEELCDVF